MTPHQLAWFWYGVMIGSVFALIFVVWMWG